MLQASYCKSLSDSLLFFFFQAEDGIRDVAVTGVQTCALPISNTQPREDKILRVDYNATSQDTLFVRLIQDGFENAGYGAILGAIGDGWGQFPHSYHNPSAGAAMTYVHTFRPNLINELTTGINRNHQGNSPT